MRILTVLDTAAFTRFRLASPRTADVRAVGFAELEARLAEPNAKLVVIDPSLIRPDAFNALLAMAQSRRNVSILIHAELTPATARAVVAASQLLPVEAVFYGSHHELDALTQICGHLLVPSVPSLVMTGLANVIAAMPSPLVTRVVGLFGGLPIPQSTAAMLNGLGVSIEVAHDWLVAAGIAKPHHLRACALLSRAYPELGQRKNRLERIVARLDIGSVRALGRACHTLVGLSARRAGRLDEVEFSRRMLLALLVQHATRATHVV